MVTIVQRDNPVLREITKEVDISTIASKEFKKILNDMKIALDSQEDGVAIAAPQIGVSLSIFLVSGKALKLISEYDKESSFDEDDSKNKFKDMYFINPKIIKLSKSTKMMEEGCLSVRYLYGKVKRSTKATIEAYDENGKKFQRGASGILAQIFQHETDHLKGVLFIDSAKDVEDLPPNKK